MATLNKRPKLPPVRTNEGAPAVRITAEAELRRSVMSCMLWEKEFYENGVSISERIIDLVSKVKPEVAQAIAIEARMNGKLRHVPLLIVRTMAILATHKHLVADTLVSVIQRPDEMTEFLSIYFKDDKDQTVSSQVKKGLARAFCKFDEYSLAKYNRDGAVKLRDVLFISHAKPKTIDQQELFKRVAENKLATPDTWETNLSAGADKKETWERLIAEGKLGAMALLKNIRNMEEAKVDRKIVKSAILGADYKWVLPFRFISAARFAPAMEPELEVAMLKNLENNSKLLGKTALLVDVSGSMDSQISDKSDLKRIDAACGLAMVLREVCDEIEIVTFSNQLVTIPSRHGFALRDAIVQSQPHGGTELGSAVFYAMNQLKPERLVVISDEQSSTPVPQPNGLAYMLNVASAKNGVGYGPWVHIDGFSEAVVNYLKGYEELCNNSKNSALE